MDKKFKQHINYFQALGLQLTGIISEWPVIGNFMKNGRPLEEIEHIVNDNLYGIGLKLGNHLDYDFLCIDIDYCLDRSALKPMLDILNLPEDYEWIIESGGGVGYHIVVDCSHKDWYNSFVALDKADKLYYVKLWEYDDNLHCHKMKFGKFLQYFCNMEGNNYSFTVNRYQSEFLKLELLWSKHSVLPPSKHKSGLNYSFLNGDIPYSTPSKVAYKDVFDLVFKYCINQDNIEMAIRSDYYMRNYLNRVNSVENFSNLNFARENIKDYEITLLLDIKYLADQGTSSAVIQSKNIEFYQISWMITDGRIIHYSESALNSDLKSDFGPELVESTGLNREICLSYGRPEQDILEMLIRDIKKVDRIASFNVENDVKAIKNLMFRLALPFDMRPFKLICLRDAFIKKLEEQDYMLGSMLEGSDELKDWETALDSAKRSDRNHTYHMVKQSSSERLFTSYNKKQFKNSNIDLFFKFLLFKSAYKLYQKGFKIATNK
ncbi:MAG: hypothetical protein ACI8ZN_000332 [Bacteroidia bacterium]|jgi:hypothetical protein